MSARLAQSEDRIVRPEPSNNPPNTGPFQGSLFDAPPPPTGPETAVPTAEANEYSAYRAWRYSEEGTRVWVWIARRAYHLANAGRGRISVKALVEACRAEMVPPVEINNTYTAWLADDLVNRSPELLALIERRKRRKAKVA